MSLTFLGWLLVVSSVAIAAVFILPRLRSWHWRSGWDLRGGAAALVAVVLLVAGIGAVTSHGGDPHAGAGPGDAVPPAHARSGPDGDMLARLKDYTKSIGKKESVPPPAG